MTKDQISLVECPRDAMQGINEFIDTDSKVGYINLLLECNFDVLDVGSFVSPKAIPQMKDTAEVLNKIDVSNSNTELLVIVANLKGAEQAVKFKNIDALGFPLSISNTFQLRNTNKTIVDSISELEKISNLCDKNNKKLVVYLSMGFGNPYGDVWHSDLIAEYISSLNSKMKVSTVALSDTIGIASPEKIFDVFSNLFKNHFDLELSAHLHVVPSDAQKKLDAAYQGGCRRFDGAIKGFGGCPMAEDRLTGNMPTEIIINYLESKNIPSNINKLAFDKAYNLSSKIFKHV